ncbi:MAG: glycerophosphodiester phosphodiesterase [Candidatus Omnitrophica bacterium]|nr:glycerophosphodiester phosphodiesterase [Candidatus Omnitrophota bacterium]
MSKDCLAIGHRGAKGLYPENTLGSVRTAMDLGVDMVEIDVHVCRTGEVVVMHDDRLERTTDGTGYVRTRSLEYLQTLNAGQGEKVPTLREVLDLIDRRIAVNVELKGRGTLGPVLRILQEYVCEKGWVPEQFILSTFMRKKLKRLARLNSKFRIGALLAYRPWGFLAFAKNVGAYSVHLNVNLVNPRIIEQAQRLGLKVYVWTVNQERDIKQIKEFGADGIFSDYPDLLK